MPPRADRVSDCCVEISRLERETLDQMKVAAGVASDANLMRIALWSLGDHLNLDMPNGVFDLRLGSGRWTRRAPNPRVRQHVSHPKPKKPAANHPWREPLADLLPKGQT